VLGLNSADGERIDASWYDGLKESTSWELTAAAHHRADDTPNRFKIYEKHRTKSSKREDQNNPPK